jgi:methionine synthase II (cobalamin-independent)
MRSSLPGFAQLFYQVGSAVNEADSCRLPLKGDNRDVIYQFPLPEGRYASLRFDPTDRAGNTITLSRARVVDRMGHVLRSIGPDQFKASHQIERLEASGTEVTLTTVLKDIADLILKVHATCYSIEASNPVHDHEWRVWQDVKLPAGKMLMPGVIGHCSDFIEHPQAIADRLVRYAKIVGRENVIAGTDCGIGSRVGHPQVGWAKFQAMAEGARIATKELWG